jgi:DNA-binding response OmpR family regulator
VDSSKQNILIIEDDEIILDILTRIFKNEFEVISCLSIESFYKAIKNVKIDLFLIDIALSAAKNGLDLITELRNSTVYKTTPIVVVSAHAYVREEKLALDAGATKYIRKPFENKYLLAEVKRILSKK